MSHARTTRRVLAAAATFGALLVTAACSSAATPGASSPAAGGVNWDERGPITYAQGKDTSGVVERRPRAVELGAPQREGHLRSSCLPRPTSSAPT